jgi:hypothetical protein
LSTQKHREIRVFSTLVILTPAEQLDLCLCSAKLSGASTYELAAKDALLWMVSVAIEGQSIRTPFRHFKIELYTIVWNADHEQAQFERAE